MKRRKQVHFKFRGRLNRAFWRRERANESSYASYVHGPVWKSGRVTYIHIPGDMIDE